MAKKVFYSFHYKPDVWRVSKIRNIGAIEDNPPAKDNDWETVTKGGDPAIQKWIEEQLKGRTCTVVLIGQETAGRKWINYEIIESWKKSMGVVGIHIHKITDRDEKPSLKGTNPFSILTYKDKPFSEVVKAYDPPGADSMAVYNTIAQNLEGWIDEAIRIRAAY